MLRISVLNEPGTTRIKLEGKLSLEWVDEAEKVWSSLRLTNAGASILVDLHAVSFVDPAGHGLLAAMHNAGAELLGSGLLMSALIAEIKAQHNQMLSRSIAHTLAGLDVKHDC
jgi:anti-anti-sigma regulatory factor